MAIHTLANRAPALEDILGKAAHRLEERLHALADWDSRFDHLDATLARRLDEGQAPSPSTVWVWRRLEDSSGQLTIGMLVSELGCSRKHLAERFHEEVGVPPKTLARLLRFNRAVRLLRASPASLPEIAHGCGY